RLPPRPGGGARRPAREPRRMTTAPAERRTIAPRGGASPPDMDGTGGGDTRLERKRAEFATPSRTLDALFLATLAAVTFEKVHWEVGASVGLADVLAALFLAGFALGRIGLGTGRLPRTVLAVVGFFLAFLLVYLVGFYNL